MHWDRLVRVAAPAAKPLDRDAAKLHLRVDFGDDDSLIDALIEAAVAMIDGPRGIGLAMVNQTWRLSLDGFVDRAWWRDVAFLPRRGFAQAIPLPMGPVQSVTSIVYTAADGTETTLDPSAYALATDLDPAVVFPAFGTCWPVGRRQPGALKITFLAGFGPKASDVPADLVAALKLLVGHLYSNRSAVVGADARVSPDIMPLSAASILDRYRAGLFG